MGSGLCEGGGLPWNVLDCAPELASGADLSVLGVVMEVSVPGAQWKRER